MMRDLRLFPAVVDLDFLDLSSDRPSRIPNNRSSQMHVISRWSAPGLFLVVAVGTLAAYDWLMSLRADLVFDHLRPVLSCRAAR